MAGSYASPVPVQVTGLESGIVQIAAGGHHTCALTNEGAALCWGDNSRGQLGNTGLEDSYSATPVPVWGMQNGVVAIAAGARHTCGLRDNGRVLCWGSNTNGELGDGTTEDRPLPVRTRHLPLTTTALALGNRHSCALTEEGAVRCWGYGYFGQLGNRTWDDSLLPRGVRRLQSGVTAIAAAQHHTCAILEGGDLRCWGANGSGQLGNNSRVSRNIPIGTWGMRYRTVSAVALGERHTCALEDNGRVWCWGNGTEGQLGMGDLAPDPNDNVEYTPVRMRGRDFGPVEGTAMATFLTDPLPRRRHVFQARYLGSETHLPSWSDVLPHRVTR